MSDKEAHVSTQIDGPSIAEMRDAMREKPSRRILILVSLAAAILIAMLVFVAAKPM